tara:strand:+ start:794 stop:2719 length:1926 start_codon:yes stop_codon:yes gene_type:complete
MTINYLDSKRIVKLSTDIDSISNPVTTTQALSNEYTQASSSANPSGQVFKAGAALIGETITEFTFGLRTVGGSGTRTGTITMGIFSETDDSLIKSFRTIAWGDLTTTDTDYTATGIHVLAADQVVGIQWVGTGGGEVAFYSQNTDVYDGTNSYVQEKGNGNTARDAKFQIKTGTPVYKPTNVQDNSILVEKDTGRRYWFDEATTITYEDDLSASTNWAGLSGAFSYDATNDEIDFNADTSGSSAYWNLGSTLSDTAWVMRMKVRLDTFSATSANMQNFNIGLSSTNGAYNATQDSIGMLIRADSAGSKYKSTWGNDSSQNGNTSDFTRTPSAETIYLEIIRTSATGFTVNQYSDTAYSTLLESKVVTGVTATALQYVKLTTYSEATTNNMVGAITDVKLYDGATSATPATWTCMGSTSSSEVSSASNVFLWLDAQDTCSITKDSSGKVSAWVNKINDTDTLVQTTASKQPIYEPNGKSTGLPAVHFDGVDDFMELPAFTSGEATQPNQYFVVYKLVSTSSVTIFSGGNNALGVNLLQDSSNNFNVHAGSSGIDGAITKDVFVLGTYLFNGSSSTVRKNGSQQGATVSAGTQGENGFTLGSARDGLGRITDIQVCEVIGISNSSSTDRDNIESYLNTKWSVY